MITSLTELPVWLWWEFFTGTVQHIVRSDLFGPKSFPAVGLDWPCIGWPCIGGAQVVIRVVLRGTKCLSGDSWQLAPTPASPREIMLLCCGVVSLRRRPPQFQGALVHGSAASVVHWFGFVAEAQVVGQVSYPGHLLPLSSPDSVHLAALPHRHHYLRGVSFCWHAGPKNHAVCRSWSC